MPRQGRIDAPGALHHVIVRGVERRKIFQDDRDRDRFVQRLGNILSETATSCYGWVLLPNHAHLLLRTGRVPIAMVMRRLLTGYAVMYNRRHHRHGHLFQNRYKSILCEEEPYLLELVRYIHLNPLRAKIVSDMQGLDSYGYAGHRVILGKEKNTWQDTETVLSRFEGNVGIARRRYREYVREGIKEGRRPDLMRGGRCGDVVAARSLLSYRAVRELGVSATELARRFWMTQPAVSLSVNRGETLVNAKALKLLDE